MDDSQRLNELFNQARVQEPKTSFNEAKARFNASLKGAGKSSFIQKTILKVKTFKTLLIMMLSITTISISLIYLFNPTVEKNATLILENELNKTKKEVETIEKIAPKIATVEAENNTDKPLIDLKKNEVVLTQKTVVLKEENPIAAQQLKKSNETENYIFPNLTKQQIDDNHKQKKKMLKELSKFDKKKYAFIPSGTSTIKGEQLSIQAFYMQTTEVSVVEYRTFLFDLLIQDRKDEFLIAKPDQTKWMEYGDALQPMEKNYFSSEAYNDYPMNNVSKEGVGLYCKWLNQEQTKAYGKIINDVRLPSKEEWMYAAIGKNEKSPYPWGGPYLRNSKGCFLANFKPGATKNNNCESTLSKLEGTANKDSLSNYYKTADNIIVPKESKDLYSADGGYFTVKVSSYNPNDFGLYCMSGNVAEMTINNDKKIVAKGGGWNSVGQQLQIEADNDFENAGEPSAEIGFRVVITYLDDRKPLVGVLGKTTTDKPPGTVQINNELYFDATEISNISWKEYVFWQANTYGENSKEHKDALPDTTVWDGLNKAYTTHYYNHPAYNNYPVVGITYNQAVAFCKWRTERVKELYKINNEIGNDFEYRLPTQAEWENIAKAGYSSINIKKDGEKQKFNLKKNKEYFMGVASKLPENADVTAPIDSYWPNDYGVYNIIGNVAEMTQEEGVAKGGSWIHTEEEANLELEISYTKPESWLGFRCVFEVIK
ncbi:SUMF1/EgtB/PvdOfamily nonheme iron enzyme [Vicingus serpentipes]|uniref:SUMF1/EgtB/PvdOfamily nonheme iron enzyme n=1 Tax=Vicingus serpentipes TaxID=1926625 RepID=A0A5C6RV31_9FLAO|nr:SUMF1/EgtB/PvdO family nonheme iron enzyme [Vicingus serpentipes]TXB65835.1 SUMF1/EgtB/PvdOfamily nonheme iron enzyme [Vicingus serpentipes]